MLTGLGYTEDRSYGAGYGEYNPPPVAAVYSPELLAYREGEGDAESVEWVRTKTPMREIDYGRLPYGDDAIVYMTQVSGGSEPSGEPAEVVDEQMGRLTWATTDTPYGTTETGARSTDADLIPGVPNIALLAAAGILAWSFLT